MFITLRYIANHKYHATGYGRFCQVNFIYHDTTIRQILKHDQIHTLLYPYIFILYHIGPNHSKDEF